MKLSLRNLLCIIVAIATIAAVFAVCAVAGDDSSASKITESNDFVTGKYVIVANDSIAVGPFDDASKSSAWITTVSVSANDGIISSVPAAAICDITVTDDKAVITLSDGNMIKPKGGNTNGITSGIYSWKWSCSNGTFTFAGTDADTVVLASNVGSDNKFRAYKTTTVSGNPAGYPSEFTLYKVSDAGNTGSEEGSAEPSEEPSAEPSEEPSVEPKPQVDFEGDYRLYFMNGETKTYIDIYDRGSEKAGVQLVLEGANSYQWNKELGIFTVTLGENVFYLGAYNDYTTIRASNITYLTNDPSKIGTSQFPLYLSDVPELEKAFTLSITQANKDNAVLYMTGAMDGYYFATSADASAAVNVYIEAVTSESVEESSEEPSAEPSEEPSAEPSEEPSAEPSEEEPKQDEYELYFIKDGVKTYLDIYDRGSGKAGVQFVTENPSKFNYNEDLGIYTVTIGENVFYLGAYNDYTRISASNITYLTNDPSKIGVTQFPVYVEGDAAKGEGKLYIVQANKGNAKYYLTGEMDSYYFATSDDVTKAAFATVNPLGATAPGDAGFAVLAIISVITLAGVVISAKKK